MVGRWVANLTAGPQREAAACKEGKNGKQQEN